MTTPVAKLLLVDDVPENILALETLLTKRGYAVQCAHSGHGALEASRAFRPDLILLDIEMPDLTGYDVAGQLKNDPALKETPIIFLSAIEDVGGKVKAFKSGGVDFIPKPAEFAEVEARVVTHLKIRKLQQELEQSNLQYARANEELLRLDELRENLTAAAKFSMWWTYYQQFDCQYVEPECRRSALDFLFALDKLTEREDAILKTLSGGHSQKTLANLRAWANDATFPLPTDGSLSLTNVLLFLTLYRSQIEGRLSAKMSHTDQMVHPEVARNLESYLMWRGHFPRQKSPARLREVMERAAATPTIVVVGDIRRSQDLMTYAVSEHDFSARIVEFISKTRTLLDEHSGFFDKFTGDGFLGYFNESICEAGGQNYIDCFVEFIAQFTGFCNAHFREWVRHVRKLPGPNVGLAIGADLGRVSFQSLDHHVVAVGESIVWASRMASAAHAEEVLVNNMLYQALRERRDLLFEEREAATKASESFRAWKLEVRPIDGK